MVISGVSIFDLSESGNGIGRHEGKVIFVDGALPGDVVDVEVVKERKKFDEGVVAQFREKSGDRVSSMCSHFGVCGGCTLQHISYERTLEFKKKWVESSFRKIGGFDVEVSDIFSSPLKYNYRNKVVFHGKRRGDEFVLGFYGKSSRELINISECYIIPSFFMELKRQIEVLCSSFSYYPSEVIFRVGKDNRVVVSFYGSCLPDVCDSVANGVIGEFSDVSGVVFFDDGKKRFFSVGDVNLVMEINDRGFLVSPESFFQVNSGGAGVLFDELKGRIGNYKRVFDLYCGVGAVGVCLGASSVVGFEVISSAIELARVNALSNGVGDATYSVGMVGSFISSMNFSSGDLVVVDPPRGGLEGGVVSALVDSGVNNIVYIGCGLGKMVRDIRGFVDGGFSVDGVFCVDLFPWSGHVETVVLMSRVDK